MSKRKKIPESTVSEVLFLSGRRCCICFGLDQDYSVKAGQIAHLDRNNQNSKPDNLAFLCLPHHDEYDTRTSQSKGWTLSEVKHYRDLLYSAVKERRREGWPASKTEPSPDSGDDPGLRHSRDLATLRKMFENIYLPTFEYFFSTARTGHIRYDLLFYWEGFDSLLLSSDFHIYNRILAKKASDFHKAWRSSLSFGDYFISLPDSNSIFRLIPPEKSGDWETWNQHYLGFQAAVDSTERSFRDLIKFVKVNFAELDVDQTNQVAISSYNSAANIVQPDLVQLTSIDNYKDGWGEESKPTLLKNAQSEMREFKSLVERQTHKDIFVNGKPQENIARALLQTFLIRRSYREVEVRGGRSDLLVFVKQGRFLYETKIWHGFKYYQQGLREIEEYIIGENDDQKLLKVFYIIFDSTKSRRAGAHRGGDFTIEVVGDRNVEVVIVNLLPPQPSIKSP